VCVAHATHTSARRGGKLDSLAMMPAMADGDKSIAQNHANWWLKCPAGRRSRKNGLPGRAQRRANTPVHI
jgi:hypothetical protein